MNGCQSIQNHSIFLETTGEHSHLPRLPLLVTQTHSQRDLLTQAFVQTSWNITRAAKLLGITRDTLRYRMEKFSLRPPGGELP